MFLTFFAKKIRITVLNRLSGTLYLFKCLFEDFACILYLRKEPGASDTVAISIR